MAPRPPRAGDRSAVRGTPWLRLLAALLAAALPPVLVYVALDRFEPAWIGRLGTESTLAFAATVTVGWVVIVAIVAWRGRPGGGGAGVQHLPPPPTPGPPPWGAARGAAPAPPPGLRAGPRAHPPGAPAAGIYGPDPASGVAPIGE